jgi:transposase
MVREEEGMAMDESDDDTMVISAPQREGVEIMLRRRDLAPRLRERLEMVKGVALGQDLVTIARWSGRSPRTIAQWLRRFHADGPSALADAPRSGRPARAGTSYQEALVAVLDSDPRSLGLLFDVWTSDRLSAYLAETTEVRICPGWLRVLIGRQRFAVGRPKHTLTHLQDAQEIATFEAEMAQVGGKDGSGAGAV